MPDSNQAQQGTIAVHRAIEISIRLALVFLLLYWGLEILRPFIDLLAWSGTIAVALYPVALYLSARTGAGEKTVGWIVCLLLIALIIVPTIQLTLASVESGREMASQWSEGKLRIPAPTDKVKDWPLIGEQTYALWQQASENLEATAHKFSDQIKSAGSKALTGIAGAGLTILKFTAAIIIAAVIMDIPLVPLWALLVLMLAIVQLPPLLILVPIAAFSFSTHETTSASIFMVYCIIGLFVGAVVLALVYQLFTEWLNRQAADTTEVGEQRE